MNLLSPFNNLSKFLLADHTSFFKLFPLPRCEPVDRGEGLDGKERFELRGEMRSVAG